MAGETLKYGKPKAHKPYNDGYPQSIMDIHNSIMDIHNSIIDIHNSIMDIHISIMDIHNCHDWIMDIHNWIMDFDNWIMDIHNYRVYALLAFHIEETISVSTFPADGLEPLGARTSAGHVNHIAVTS